MSLGVKVNYVIYSDNEYKVIPVSDNYLDLLNKLREESNLRTMMTYDERVNNLKRKMLERVASNEEFNELSKIENIYLKMN